MRDLLKKHSMWDFGALNRNPKSDIECFSNESKIFQSTKIIFKMEQNSNNQPPPKTRQQIAVELNTTVKILRNYRLYGTAHIYEIFKIS